MLLFRRSTLPLLVTLAVTQPALATNGMNLEGYGPIATAMGGAGYAYDNGVAALMNNPATLGLQRDAQAELDLFLGFLGPDVAATPSGFPTADSGGDAYYMPAFGYARRHGDLTWAVGIMAQGGMGTEYGADSALAMGSGDEVRSEVGVGRGILGMAYRVNERLSLGGSLDLVWASMDLKMAVPASMLTDAPGGLITGRSGAYTAADFTSGGAANWGRFDFSNNNDMFGDAKGYGYGMKLGLTYRVNDMLQVGAAYHSQTRLSDMKTDDAVLSTDAMGAAPGTIHVHDFEWPATYGVGLSLTPTDRLQLALDVKKIRWSKVMDSFRMTFSDSNGSVEVTMPQNWRDQTVVAGGLGYRWNPRLTLRAGFNLANNPIPDNTVNPLFPAIVERHYTAGFGYRVQDDAALDFALSYAPEVSVTNSVNGTRITHSQLNWQLMYSLRFN